MAREHHLAPSERSQAYADAIFAIVATIMIVPLSGEAVREIAENENLLDGIGEIWFKLVVYALSFGLVSSTWDLHAWVFRMIEKVNETIVLLNLGVLMLATFLPYAFLMFAEHPREPLAVALFSGCVAIQGFFMLAILWHASSRPNLLKKELAQQGTEKMKSLRTRATIRVLIRPVIYLIAIPVSYGSVEVAWALLVLAVLKPVLYTVGDAIVQCARGNVKSGTKLLKLSRLYSETSDVVRTNAYSDGFYAIVATLIILDICVNNVPATGLLDIHGTLAEALARDADVFLSYAGTFVTICLLWYLHHSMFYLIRAQNSLLLTFNKLALLFAGYLPIVFKLTGEFGHLVRNQNSSVAVQLNSGTVFMASIWLLAIWITAMSKKSELLRPSAHNIHDCIFMFLNLLIYPIVSLVIFCVCFAVPVPSAVINGAQIALIAVFILLKLLRNWTQRCVRKSEPKESPEIGEVGEELSSGKGEPDGPTKEDLEGYDNPVEVESTSL
ncbi:TMEM175 [Branchiostoma lanceolatum]|uniref:Endosomal/lysosomal proton channel TMEM175 n=1 Tax=Branchiostoma lanceolatum TaxID=7740 RepID=A0A8K0ED08_BRALA|nr:TMEM175 [Branchiostoma lanceolatum]